ncbi:MAG: hypothetical protein OXU61_09855, partial [Gammaproteobacteria bacterium]|nr:hypothetical protein [Gammaproteobacteria bacterium]
ETNYGSLDLTITDNDGYTLSVAPGINTAANFGVAEGAAESSRNIRVQYANADGSSALGAEATVTATILGEAPGGVSTVTSGYPAGILSERAATATGAGADFASDSFTCTIPAATAHNAIVNCPLPAITDDTLSERVEHFSVELSGGPAGIMYGAKRFHFISASDPIGMRISAANYTGTEGGGAVTVTVEFSAAAGTTIPTLSEFRLLFDDGATTFRTETPGGGDDSLISPTPIWARAVGSRGYDFTVPANAADTTPEADEVQTWRLRGTIAPVSWDITGGDVGDDGTFTVTFADDDPTSWTVRARGGGQQMEDVNEDAAAIASPTTADTAMDHADIMYFRFTNYEGLDTRGETVVTYCLAGTASGGTAAQVTANPNDHDYTWPSGYDPASTSAAHSAYQGSCNTGRGSFTIAVGTAPHYRLGIALNDDSLNEGDETILAEVVNVTEAGHNTRLEQTDVAYIATRTIKDNDPVTASIANAGTDADADAADFQVQEGGNARFTVTLSGGARGGDVIVRYTISGDVAADDYTDSGNGALTIAAADSSGEISIALTEDADTASEALTVTLDASGHTAAGVLERHATNNAATQNVITRPIARTLRLRRFNAAYDTEATGAAVAENVGNLYFLADLDGMSPTQFTTATEVTWTVNHAGANGTSAADFTAVTGTLTFPTAGCTASTAACQFTVAVTDDNLDENSSEGFSVTLSVADPNADSGTSAGSGSGDLTITDNDRTTFNISTAATAVSEGGNAVVSIRLSTPADRQVTIDYSATSSAASGLGAPASGVAATRDGAGVDFGTILTGATVAAAAAGTTVTFDAGQTTAELLV